MYIKYSKNFMQDVCGPLTSGGFTGFCLRFLSCTWPLFQWGASLCSGLVQGDWLGVPQICVHNIRQFTRREDINTYISHIYIYRDRYIDNHRYVCGCVTSNLGVASVSKGDLRFLSTFDQVSSLWKKHLRNITFFSLQNLNWASHVLPFLWFPCALAFCWSVVAVARSCGSSNNLIFIRI
jgi:hypothetical protein